MMANSAIETSHAPPYPRPVEVASEIGSNAGISSVQNGKWYAPTVAPTMKKINVTNITVRPPPIAYRVPEAHPPPSCMPIPNKKAPTIKLTPTGETYPETGPPKKDTPNARIGANNVTATASINICARIACPLPTDVKRRNADVNPKRA